MECIGRHADGELFLEHGCHSTYETDSGRRLADNVVVVRFSDTGPSAAHPDEL